MKKDNIVLIGMPGVGKSTVGVILAKVLGYQFLDTDLLIQHEEGLLLCEIIEKRGVDGFLAVENRVNASIAAERTVIATGGSAVYGREAMEHLCGLGTVLYLEAPYEVLGKRLADIRGRGVVLKEGQSLRDLYLERTPLYEAYADLRVGGECASVEQTVTNIIEKLDFWNNNRANHE